MAVLEKINTKFTLDMDSKLRSKYSKRMYEFLSQYKKQGNFTISVEELKGRLSLIDVKTGVEKYLGWHMFADHILERPQKELNEHTDIFFSYMPKKTNRSFTHIEFNIFPNSKYKTA